MFSFTKKNGHRIITLRDKRILVLSEPDIKEINHYNGINFRRYRDPSKKKNLQKLLEYVHLCFAVIVRNIQVHGYDGKEYTQSAAIKLLTREGMKVDRLHTLLGLDRKTPSANFISLKHLPVIRKKRAVLLYSDRHIVVASGGFYENFGEIIQLNNEIPSLKGRKASHWFELR